MTNNTIRKNVTAVETVDDLLSCYDEQFVRRTYLTLLGREPDPAGRKYYLGRLRAGYGKAKIITQIAESAEAKTFGADLAGLRELVAAQKKACNWFWKVFSRGERIERQVHRLEYELGRIAQQLVRLENDTNQRAARNEPTDGAVLESVNGLSVNTSGATDQPELPSPEKQTSPDLSGLTPRARQISARLTLAMEQATEGRGV